MENRLSTTMCLLLVLLLAVSSSSGKQDWEEQPSYSEVNPGGEVVLTCRVKNKRGVCSWERNSRPVGVYPGKYEMAGDQSRGDCSLRIIAASQEYDSGEWMCQVTASNFTEKDTLMSRPAQLIVREPPKSVFLRQSPPASSSGSDPGWPDSALAGPVTGVAGTQISVECGAVGGAPAPRLLWYLGEQPLSSQHGVHTEAATRTGRRASTGVGQPGDDMVTVSRISLTVEREHHGRTLRCQVEHPALQQLLDVRTYLDIQYLPRATISPTRPDLDRLAEGTSLQLTCQVEANPLGQVIWYRNNSGVIVSKEPSLTLTSVKKKDAGIYVCQATNLVGEGQPAYVNVGVEYGPVIQSVGPGEKVDRVRGSKIQLTCSADSIPPPTYQWVHHTTTGVVVRGSEPTLVLDSVQYQDEGVYECHAFNFFQGNKHSAVSKPVQVNVFGSPVVIERESQADAFLSTGVERGEVSVEFCSDPLPKQIWHINSAPGQRIVLGAGTVHERFSVAPARPSQRQPDCYISTLVIAGAQETDTADYLLHLENEHGQERHVVRVRVGQLIMTEALVGGLVGGGVTLVVLAVLLIWMCRSCVASCEESAAKAAHKDQESGVEKWSTGSEGSGDHDSEISTGTHNTSHSSAMHSAYSTTTHNTSLSNGTGVTNGADNAAAAAIVAAANKKNVSFNASFSVSQECLKPEGRFLPISRGIPAPPPPTGPEAAVGVSYNELCFPKTSNYGSMRKSSRWEPPTRHQLYSTGSTASATSSGIYHVNSEYDLSA